MQTRARRRGWPARPGGRSPGKAHCGTGTGGRAFGRSLCRDDRSSLTPSHRVSGLPILLFLTSISMAFALAVECTGGTEAFGRLVEQGCSVSCGQHVSVLVVSDE